MDQNIEKILETLSPNERKILPYLEESLTEICQKSNLDKVSVLRSLEYLKNKGLIELSTKEKKIIELGVNGVLYKKKGLPERRLLNLLNEKRIISLADIKKQSDLSEDELKASIGVLKRRNLIDLKNEKIVFNANKGEIAKKSTEEIFIDSLPLDYDGLNQEQLVVFDNLKRRKDLVLLNQEKIIDIKLTSIGKKLSESNLSGKALIEQITPELLNKESSWKGKKFRRYDVTLPISQISGGKRHFVNQASDYARRIWSEMGFKEFSGDMVVSSFWNFDALFTAQDHPVREMQDTFFLNKKGELPNKEIVRRVKKSHEEGVEGSEGWKYQWNEEEAKKLVLRTHTTCLSPQALSQIKPNELPQKFFMIGKVFRNETVDWKHGFEFNQTEGIVVDKNANFRHLLGYLKQFFKKMGYEKLRFRPAFFPYTEPSLEIDFWHEERKEWLELGGAGIFRPEVTAPLFGENVPVLAWGPGFDRILMNYYGITDIRDLYKNNLTKLRKTKFWMK